MDLPTDIMLGVDVKTATTETVNERVAADANDEGEKPHDVLRIGAFYEILGVPPDCSLETARKSYYQLAKAYHPDKNPDADRAKFALINRAFEVIKDPESRRRYDLTERVRHALRQGVECRIHEDDGEVCFFVSLFFFGLINAR